MTTLWSAMFHGDGEPFTIFGENGMLRVPPSGMRTDGIIMLDTAIVRGRGGSLLTGFYGLLVDPFYTLEPLRVARFGLRGLERMFGTGGIITVPEAHTDEFPVDTCHVISTPDEGAIVISVRPRRIALWKFNGRGEPDTTLGSDGVRIVSVPSDVTAGRPGLGFDTDSNGRITGAVFSSMPDRMIFMRFLADGTPDSSFGSGGFQTVAFPGRAFSNDRAFALLPTGESAAAAAVRLASGDLSIQAIRLGADGQPLWSFGGDGIVGFPFPGSIVVRPAGIAFGSRGNIVVAALEERGDEDMITLLKIDSTGELITGFGDRGIARHTIPQNGHFRAHDMAVRSDETVVVGLLTIP